MQGVLYVVGTPIGNLGDFSARARNTLELADFIAAEDSRVTLKLLNYFNIKKPIVSYHEHNKRQKGEDVLLRIQKGESCALVTDAGMPAISDPGEDLVSLCSQNGINVIIIPGPCAAIAALAASGLPSGRFCFEGFLSVNKKNRREHLAQISKEPRTLIFYEAPHKLKQTLKDLYETLGDRRIACVRELTKIHEETFRTTISAALDFYSQNEPKGEFVLVIEGMLPVDTAEEICEEEKAEKAAALVKQYISEGCSHTQAVKRASKEAAVSRSELYKLTL